MKKIFAVAMAVIIILLAGIAIVIFYTPYNVPFVSQLFLKETAEETAEEPFVSDTGKLPVATTTPEEDKVDAEDKSEVPPEEIIPKKEEASVPEPERQALKEPEKETPVVEIIPKEEEEEASVLEPEPKIPREPKEYIVEIYSFTDWRPANFTLYVGDTLTFINFDDTLHWPGSDPHPTHSSLPLFDALGGISEGQSYSHTFTVPGIYGHHDHLPEDPPTLGTIIVLPAE